MDGMDWLSSPLVLIGAAFQIWMLVDAVLRREWIWALCILVFSATFLPALFYFFLVHRQGGGVSGFELPGTYDRKRIKELEAKIHHLDKAHHYFELGDILLHQNKLAKAEEAYRAALERDAKDIDIRAHLGLCLLRLKKWTEARPLLEGVCRENPKHDYGYSLMALAEVLTEAGETETAIQTWEQVMKLYSYSRARVQLAELLLARGEKDRTRRLVEEVIAEEPFTPPAQRQREKIWLRRARSLRSKIN
jgi:tetratricopeptide (TPR) repeat protein